MNKVLIVFLTGIIINIGFSQPIKIVNEFYKNMKDKNIDKVFSFFHSESDLNTIKKEDLTSALEENSVEDYNFNWVSNNDKQANVRGYIIVKSEKRPIDVVLLHEDNTWKIYSISRLPSPIDIVNIFYNALKEHNAERAIELLHDESVLLSVDIEELKTSFKEIEIDTFDFKNIEKDEEMALVKGFIISEGVKSNVQVTLFPSEDLIWRIYDIGGY